MQVLYTSLHYPLPVANGGTMRLWAMLRAIASLGHEITLVCFSKPGEVRGTEAQLREVCRDNELVEMEFTRMAEGSAYLNRLLAIFSPTPFKFARFRSPEMRMQREAHHAPAFRAFAPESVELILDHLKKVVRI